MLRRELHLDVQMTEGHYGEFTVLVDGEEVASGGPLAFLGVLPSVQTVRALVKNKLQPSRQGND